MQHFALSMQRIIYLINKYIIKKCAAKIFGWIVGRSLVYLLYVYSNLLKIPFATAFAAAKNAFFVSEPPFLTRIRIFALKFAKIMRF